MVEEMDGRKRRVGGKDRGLDVESLGQRIRALRTGKGLSQDELARVTERSRQHVFQVERGDIRHLRGETLKRYAQALGVSERYLETGHELPPRGEDWPPLDVCLRHTTKLSEEQIDQVERLVHALEAEQKLAQLLAEREAATGTS